jgi:rhodanese-related sulfurtransferase
MNSIRLGCRFGIATFVLLAVVCGSGCVDWLPGDAEVQNVTPDQAAALIQDRGGDANFVILDVRGSDEFAGGHIADAVNLCYLCSAFADSIASLDKSKTYLVYCGSEHRSPLAVAAMKSAGFTSLYNMTGGLAAWKTQGLPVVQ